MRNRNIDTVRIRVLIMLIAVLGGLGFLGFLAFTMFTAHENERRVADLHYIKFPVIEELLRLKRDVSSVHESFSAALAFENYFILEDTYEAARNFSDRVGLINELEPSTEQFTAPIQNSFADYYESAKDVAKILIADPEKSSELAPQLAAINDKLSQVNAQLVSAIQVRKQEYQSILEQTSNDMKRANRIGGLLGGLLLVGLVLLAWAVSARVVYAINRSNQLKEVFLATMSHELRTPINGIAGAISLLEKTPLDDEQSKLVAACHTSEIAITTTVDDILQFSTMISGKFKLAAKPFLVNQAVRSVMDLFAVESQTKGLEMIFQSDVGDDLAVVSDEGKLSHALRHLMSNAVKFSQGSNVTVELKQISGHSTRFKILIHDTGPGISERHLKMVFEPFQQIDGSFSRRHQGVGIGLPICKYIAQAMDGDVRLINRREGGLTASFSFTVEALADTHGEAFGGSSRVESSQVSPQPKDKTGAQMVSAKMLIVEDNKVNQLVLKGYLKKMGITVDLAENGVEAVERVAKNHYDLIFMDCQMPVMDGFEATKQIRQQVAERYVLPIVAVTANAMEGDRERCLEAGMDDYIPKPVDAGVLTEVIEKYVRSGAASKFEA